MKMITRKYFDCFPTVAVVDVPIVHKSIAVFLFKT